MQQKYASLINFLYGPWLRIIGFFHRVFRANRARLRRIKANSGVAGMLRAATVLVVVAWILVWMFASDADRRRLTDEVRQSIGGSGSAPVEQAPP